jgi:hypothetical protein
MVLNAAGEPQYIGQREASIAAWFSETLTQSTTIDLCANAGDGLFTDLVAR